MTAAGVDLPIGQFLRQISSELGVSFIWSAELDGATVSLEVIDVPLVDVLRDLARRLDVDLTGSGDLYYLGKAREADRASYVRRVGRLSSEDVDEVVRSVVTAYGDSVALSDGLLVVVEHVSVLHALDELLDEVERLGQSSWLVQLLLVESLDRNASTLGIDTSFDLEIAASFTEAATTTTHQGEARAALKADITSERVNLVAQPMFVCLDGEEALLKRGEVVPIPQYTTLETGAVVTSGYSEVEIGMEFKVSCRDWSDGRATLAYDISLGEIAGYIDDRVPIRSEESLTGASVVQSGGTYLLGSLERSKRSQRRLGTLNLGRDVSSDASRLEVWALVTRVGESSFLGMASAAGVLPTEMLENVAPGTPQLGGVSDIFVSSALDVEPSTAGIPLK